MHRQPVSQSDSQPDTHTPQRSLPAFNEVKEEAKTKNKQQFDRKMEKIQTQEGLLIVLCEVAFDRDCLTY